MGIGIVLFLVPGWIALELLGYPKAEIFQNLVYWACFLLILAVHELSKRTEKAAVEVQSLRAEMEGTAGEIRRLQTALRERQGSERVSLPSSMPTMAPGAAPQSRLASVTVEEAPSPSDEFSLRNSLGFIVIGIAYLVVQFWSQISSWFQGAR